MRRGKSRSSRFGKRSRRAQGFGCRHERLEPRLALAVEVLPFPVVAGRDNWVTVVANAGDDVYVQQVSNIDNDLFIAPSASFSPASRTEIPDFATTYNNLSVYAGRRITVSDDIFPRARELSANQLSFHLPLDINPAYTTRAISGQLDLDNGTVVAFDNTDQGGVGLVFTVRLGGVPTGQTLTGAVVPTGDTSRLTLSGGLFATVGENPRLTFFSIEAPPGGGAAVVLGQPVGVRAAGVSPQFAAVDLAGRQYVPGTLSGTAVIDVLGGLATTFQVETQGTGVVPLSFGGARTIEASFASAAPSDAGGLGGGGGGVGVARAITYRISGSFDSDTGIVTFYTFIDGADASFSPPQALPVRISAIDVAVRELADVQANNFTLFPGHDFAPGLTVELPNVGSRVSIESPLISTDTVGGGGLVTLSAATINVNAAIRAARGFLIPPDVNAGFGTISEIVTLNAPVSSPAIEISLADDPATPAIVRSRLAVSQTGSLSAVADVTTPPGATLTPSDTIFLEVLDGDIYIEGRVVADFHSYFMSSPVGSEAESPYVLTTASRQTGITTGSIEGGTLAITLANDTFGSGFDSIASSAVTITTAVDRLRIQAADRQNDALEEPFPYLLTVTDSDDLIVDAVAASSQPVAITAGGSLDLLAAIVSGSDVSVAAGKSFVVSAPIETAFGAISLSAPEIDVRSAVRILDQNPDERVVDIDITTTAGSLILSDAVHGMNRVRLTQTGQGSISGLGRVGGDTVEVRADGDVGLFTDANVVVVTTPGTVSVNELGAAAFEIRNSPTVTLIANGYDLLLDADRDAATPAGEDGDGRESLSPALFADIFDTETLVVSAPRGSIDVLHSGANRLAIGNLDDVVAGTATTMQAGGSVVIRSTLSSGITVYDSPTAASGAVDVRVATTAELNGTAQFGTPGVGRQDLAIMVNYDAGNKVVTELDGIDVTSLRLGDRVLVKNGLESLAVPFAANGIYSIYSIQFTSATRARIGLTRLREADTTAELSPEQYVRVTDGTQNRGRIFTSRGFSSVAPPPADALATPLRVAAVPVRPGFTVVEAVSTAVLTGATYDRANGTISATAPGAIADFAGFNQVLLAQDDLVLVRYGTGSLAAPNNTAIGVYRVTNAGDANNPWKLTRYPGLDEDGDGNADAVFTGIVAVAQGSLRTRLTGDMFEVVYDSLNHAALNYVELADYREALAAAAAEDRARPAFDPVSQFRTDIGSNDPDASVTYIVSTENGTNTATGSLGRMLTLVQENTAIVGRNGEPVDQRIDFGTGVTSIILDQALPAITVPLDIVPARAVAIDGSRISLTADGAVVRSSALTNGMGPVRPSQVATARKLVRNVAGQNAPTTVHGLRFEPGSDGSTIRNMVFGGFTSGAGILVDGAANVLVDTVTLGRSAAGMRLPNKYGVMVDGEGDGTGQFTTILNSTIVNSSEAGVLLNAGTDGVRLVGNRIGLIGQANVTGVEVIGGSHAIGVAPILPNTAIPALSISPLALNGRKVAVPVNVTTDSIGVGTALYDAAGLRTWRITEKRYNAATSRYDLTLAGPAFTSVTPVSVEAGIFIDAVARSTQFILPAGVDANQLFIGQGVASVVPGVLPSGTVITGIGEDNGVVTVSISREMLTGGKTAILFTAPTRNLIEYNEDGIVLSGGAATIVGTDVMRSVYDGIVIDGVDLDGAGHRIGGLGGINGIDNSSPLVGQPSLSANNAVIAANGLSGIRFTQLFFRALGAGLSDQERFDATMDSVAIRGNFLGTNLAGATGLTNGPDGATNFKVDDAAVAALMLADATPVDNDPRDGDPDGRYSAPYRPEDTTTIETLFAYVGYDIMGNLHGAGQPDDPPDPTDGGGHGDGGTVRHPPRR